MGDSFILPDNASPATAGTRPGSSHPSPTETVASHSRYGHRTLIHHKSQGIGFAKKRSEWVGGTAWPGSSHPSPTETVASHSRYRPSFV